MAANNNQKEGDLRELLLANPGRGIELLDLRFRVPTCGFVRANFPSLSPEDIADCWQNTLMAVLAMVKTGTLKRSDDKISTLLRTIAYRRAIDRLELNLRRGGTVPPNSLENVAANEPIDTLEQREIYQKKQDIYQKIRAAICELPQKERVVWSIYAAHYPETRSDAQLLTNLVQQVDPSATYKSVTSALYRGRKRLALLFAPLGDELWA